MRELVMDPIGNRAIVVEGGEDLLDRGQDRLYATDIEKRLLLTRKLGVRQVLCGRTGPHRE